MHPQVGSRVYSMADKLGRELDAKEIRDAFFEEFVNLSSPLKLEGYELEHHLIGGRHVTCRASVMIGSQKHDIMGDGNGPINRRGSKILRSSITVLTRCVVAPMQIRPPISKFRKRERSSHRPSGDVGWIPRLRWPGSRLSLPPITYRARR